MVYTICTLLLAIALLLGSCAAKSAGTGREDRTGFLFDACKNSCGGCTNQQSCTNGGLFGNRGCCWSTSTLTCLAPGLLLGSDVLNCGACNRVCSTNNIPLPLCSAGQCTGVCRPGFGDCDNNKWLNGCETNIRNSPVHCGRCGNPCVFPNSVPRCTNGICSIGSCRPGFGNCDARQANGCETNIRTNVRNCGACGTVCNPAQTCQNGRCI